MLEQDLRALNSRIDSLINKVQTLNAENNSLKQALGEFQSVKTKIESLTTENDKLRQQENVWLTERQKLLAEREELSRKNDHARARVEAIILRLKALETPEA
ncbi:MAG TPA: hypothetical protein PLF28_07880 [Agitococcus sp.]|jgi:cell division protein ZapB|nr:hypothetical protein [Agitococcus sp.]HMY82340.1 hypothetical protein [Agitococcus sp.]HNC86234.1 hypothetical protein [Agitococcus sp.]HNE91490.1 hypothetical protein [Agitococcus sp.]HNG11095.1 hypothetical protein [Agitococcus sp.]